jgi:hypothetical protein
MKRGTSRLRTGLVAGAITILGINSAAAFCKVGDLVGNTWSLFGAGIQRLEGYAFYCKTVNLSASGNVLSMSGACFNQAPGQKGGQLYKLSAARTIKLTVGCLLDGTFKLTRNGVVTPGDIISGRVSDNGSARKIQAGGIAVVRFKRDPTMLAFTMIR